MPHRCIHCGRMIEAGSHELLDGCVNCSGKFFFYIRDEQYEKLKLEEELKKISAGREEETGGGREELGEKGEQAGEIIQAIESFNKVDKNKVERDVRSILKIENEEKPVILDIESVKVLEPGKFEIDLVNLLNKKPIVFKLEEGKYIIDLESSLPGKKEKI